MNEQTTDKAPIGRYILIVFLFVLIFIGAAYLVYRFTNRGSTVVTPSPKATPAVTYQSGGTVTPQAAGSGPFYPTPQLQPVNPNARAFTLNPYPNLPLVKTATNGSNTHLVAQDGRGNLLINNLTHDEFASLELARLQADSQLRQLQERNHTTLEGQKLANAGNASAQTSQQQYQLTTQQRNLDAQLSLAKLQSQARLDELKFQLATTQRQHEASPNNPVNQVKLAELQLKLHKESAEQQRLNQLALAKEARLAEISRAAGQLALGQAQADSQLRSALLQTTAQAFAGEQQKSMSLAQIAAAQKAQETQLAYETAARQRDQQFALKSTKLNAKLTRQLQLDQAEHAYSLMMLQQQQGYAPNYY